MTSAFSLHHSPFAIRHSSFAIRHSEAASRVATPGRACRHPALITRHSSFVIRHSEAASRVATPERGSRHPAFINRNSPFAIRHSEAASRVATPERACRHPAFINRHSPFAILKRHSSVASAKETCSLWHFIDRDWPNTRQSDTALQRASNTTAEAGRFMKKGECKVSPGWNAASNDESPMASDEDWMSAAALGRRHAGIPLQNDE